MLKQIININLLNIAYSQNYSICQLVLIHCIVKLLFFYLGFIALSKKKNHRMKKKIYFAYIGISKNI